MPWYVCSCCAAMASQPSLPLSEKDFNGMHCVSTAQSYQDAGKFAILHRDDRRSLFQLSVIPSSLGSRRRWFLCRCKPHSSSRCTCKVWGTINKANRHLKYIAGHWLAHPTELSALLACSFQSSDTLCSSLSSPRIRCLAAGRRSV